MTKKNLGKLAHFKLMRKPVECRCAYVHQDQKLLMRISRSDLIAQEAKYHLTCLVLRYTKADRITCGGSDCDESNQSHGRPIVFAQAVEYISDCRIQDSHAVFRLADILKLYTEALESLAVLVENCIVCSITFWVLWPTTHPVQPKMSSACFQRQS